MHLSSYLTRADEKGSRRRQQQPAMTVVPPPSVVEDASVVRVPEAHLVDPAFTEDGVARAVQAAREQTQAETDAAIARAVQQAREQTQAENDAAIARAVQQAREQARQAIREELLHQERNEERNPVVQAELLQEKDAPHDTPDEEEISTFRIPAFIRKHAVLVSCLLCSLLLFGAVGAGLGVAFSSGENSESNSHTIVPSTRPPTIAGEPSSTPTRVESPTPSPLDETAARAPSPTPSRVESFRPTENPTLVPSGSPTLIPTKEPTPQPTKNPTPQRTRKPTPQPTKNPTLYPTPHPTQSPTHLPTTAPVVVKTASPTTSSTVGGISSWTQVGSTLRGMTPGDYFGSFNALALSSNGTVIAVGANENDDVANSTGYVQVFRRDSDGTDQDQAHQGWQTMGAALTGVAAEDQFGDSVALSANGQILAVGADEFDTGRPGYVRVFAYDTGNDQWNPRGSKIVGVAERDSFGRSVALSFDGNKLAVGAASNDDIGSNAGHVRVFIFDSNSNEWVQQGSTLTGVAADDWFGNSIDLSADGAILAIGARSNDDNGIDSGHLRVFQFNNNSNDWDPMGAAITGRAEGDYLGQSVALSANGMVLAVGAPYSDDNGSESGHVRVFDYSNSSNQWVQRGFAVLGVAEFDAFGWSVALSADGNQVVAGAVWNDAFATNSGHVRVFQYEDSRGGGGGGGGGVNSTTTGQWMQVGPALTGEGGVRDYFGASVAMSADGTDVAGGAQESNTDFLGPGYVCVYEA